MSPPAHTPLWTYWTLTLASLVAAAGLAIFYAPTEPVLGLIQKLTYLHVPTAVTTFLLCLVVFVGNVGYIWQRNADWDALAGAAAEVALGYCTVVLVTGMIWARAAWDVWWTWSPLLTFSLVLWLLYLAYVVVRRLVHPVQRREIVCAVYGVIAFVDVPLVYLSVKLLPDKHPAQTRLTPEMVHTLLVWFVPVVMIGAGLIHLRFGRNKRARLQAGAAPDSPTGPSFRSNLG